MIVIVRKNNIALIMLIFLLSIVIYSLNIWSTDAAVTANDSSVQRVVILDPGHGGEDPGMVSPGGLKEKDINLIIAFKAKELLENDNYKVIMTRTEDKLEYPEGTKGYTAKRKADLLRRKNIMDTSGADIVVSIHLNSFVDDTSQRGAQAFYPHNSTESQKLALCLQKAVKEIVDPNNKRNALVRGKPNETPIIILRDLKTPTAILECGFLSNPEDEKLLATDEHQTKLAMAIKAAVDSYFSGT
ncbi:N-acetylmuramoyl-L-alanine amidase [Pseudoclostridium thermosuccinogenes]|uniref:N-acetylmuramoyl-L-alanine amidase n=1 Tax=Clostridium thermosuccinogenes TaxID=84032 RepID=UPI002FDB7B10